MKTFSQLSLAVSLVLALAACQPEVVPIAQDIDEKSVCSLDGMSLADYPGPKAQIRFADSEHPEFFCDTVEMLNILKAPDQQRQVLAAYTQDMAKANWDTPRGNWIDARTAFYVVNSKKHGAMGPTLVGFASRADADAFVKVEGGSVKSFAEVQGSDVVLDGGALHDQHM